MISMPLFKRNIWSGCKLLLIFIAILGMYSSVIIWMFDPELSNMLNEYQEIMPGLMSAVGMTGSTGTLIAFINTYLYGFLMLLVPMIFEIMLVNKLIMKYVDNGSMACLLATPNSRRRIITTQLSSILLLVFLMIAIMTGIGLACSEIMFPGELEVEKYVLLNLATLLLHFAVSGIAVFASCFFNETKHYLAWGAGIPLVFYLIQMLSNMGDKLEGLKYCTIFTLLPGTQIIDGSDGVLLKCLVLAAIGIVLYGAAQIRFLKKDLPL